MCENTMINCIMQFIIDFFILLLCFFGKVFVLWNMFFNFVRQVEVMGKGMVFVSVLSSWLNSPPVFEW
jgi:hypothetical protein